MAMPMEEKIVGRIRKLKEIALEYEALEEETNGKYRYRYEAICKEVDILNSVLEGEDIVIKWQGRLDSDKKEAEEEKNKRPVNRQWGEVIE